MPAEEDQLLRARDLLQRRADDQGTDLPVALGRAALRLEALLADGPTGVDPSKVDPARTISSAERVLQVTATLFDLIEEDGPLLGEVLTIDVSALGLEALSELAEAVLGLNAAPRAWKQAWGSPRRCRAPSRTSR